MGYHRLVRVVAIEAPIMAESCSSETMVNGSAIRDVSRNLRQATSSGNYDRAPQHPLPVDQDKMGVETFEHRSRPRLDMPRGSNSPNSDFSDEPSDESQSPLGTARVVRAESGSYAVHGGMASSALQASPAAPLTCSVKCEHLLITTWFT